MKPVHCILCVSFQASAVVESALGQIYPTNITFKGTHNSYASECGGTECPFFCGCNNVPPVIHDPPWAQVDDWGVWVLELDFSVPDSDPQPIIGHNGPGWDSWAPAEWGYYLRDYLQQLAATRSFCYRPLFVYFNKLSWAIPDYQDEAEWRPLVDEVVRDVFCDVLCDREHNEPDNCAGLYTPTQHAARDQVWPTLQALAGKVVPLVDGQGSPWLFGTGYPGLASCPREDCISLEVIYAARAEGCNLIRIDQYQNDWSFAPTAPFAPPNPLVVRSDAGESTPVENRFGDDAWCLFSDDPNSFSVAPHGTFRFPFARVSDALQLALPGWTVLIAAGSYPEAMTIDFPLTLEADGGTVTIGQ